MKDGAGADGFLCTMVFSPMDTGAQKPASMVLDYGEENTLSKRGVAGRPPLRANGYGHWVAREPGGYDNGI